MSENMTPSDPRVGEIQALAEGLTDLCPEHLRQSIRHVQRNCDIDCTDHENSVDWDVCKQPDRYDGERIAKALAGIPYLLAELRDRDEKLARVEALHVPDELGRCQTCTELAGDENDRYWESCDFPCPTATATAADGGGQ